MEFDALVLSRLQFAFTIAFHIVFPSLSIGLASYLAVLEGLWLRTGEDRFMRLYDYWVKIFALAFGMGVVSGVVMSYQIGTNWSAFAQATGNVLGPLFGYEVLAAFFLEASFLGIMLFGRQLVGPGLHFFATCMVAFGTLVSAFFILAANSWMQFPTGHEYRDGIFYATDWMAIIFSPTFPYRLVHMVLAAYLTTAFVVAGAAAWLMLKRKAVEDCRTMFKMAFSMIAVVSIAQVIAGHEHGVSVYETQPTKLAAIEGHWETYEGRAPLVLFAWPDAATESNLYEFAVPEIGSWVVTGDWNGRITGLKEWLPEDRPNVPLVFWSFRIMVGIGILMVLYGLVGAYASWTGAIDRWRWFQAAVIPMLPSGFIAIIAGWITAEAGRQPWTVYGLMRTADSVSPVAGSQVAVSLAAFVAIYAIVFPAGIYYMGRVAMAGPGGKGQTAKPKKRKTRKARKTQPKAAARPKPTATTARTESTPARPEPTPAANVRPEPQKAESRASATMPTAPVQAEESEPETHQSDPEQSEYSKASQSLRDIAKQLDSEDASHRSPDPKHEVPEDGNT